VWHRREDRVKGPIASNGPAEPSYRSYMTGRVEQRETRYRGAELKFLIDEPTAAGIRQWARRQMQPDANGGGAHGDDYHTTTIYLDTSALDVYWRRRSYGRSKLRIRRYGDAGHAFVERKLRTGCVLAKRRTMVPLAELAGLQAPRAGDWAARWFSDRVRARQLTPTCQVAYLRTARTMATDMASHASRSTPACPSCQPIGRRISRGAARS
jgi:hypothetical protein